MIARPRLRVLLAALMLTLATSACLSGLAYADGDPGSDVLVYQPLFVASDAGVRVHQQVALGAELRGARRAGFPIRVAIIAHRFDLGAVTALWRRPQAYARFLGLELSLAYRQRLLIVMPNGIGFNWPGHATAATDGELSRIVIRPGGAGLATAAEAAVATLARADGVRLGSSPVARSAPTTGAARTPTSGAARTPTIAINSARSLDTVASILVASLAVAWASIAVVGRRRRRSGHPRKRRLSPPRIIVARRGVTVAAAGVALFVVAGSIVLVLTGVEPDSQAKALATNPQLDPGTPLSELAPGFTLSDQFGRPVSLRSYRGKVVLLAFNDSECTTICPLTTTAMLDAKRMLGSAGSQVQLLGVDANPKATSIEDVLSYSQLHGMVRAWRFATGSLAALKRVWRAYGIQADIQRGQIAHTPALFVIDPSGRLRRLYVTQQSYAAVGQLGQLLARETSSLLPGHPTVQSDLSYQPISGISPAVHLALPRAGGGTVALGPSRSPHLYLFFDTWDEEVTSLAGHLDALSRYQATASRTGLPPLTAVDEGAVEPSPQALPAFLRTLARPLSYPVAVDRSGRVADGYEVQGQPWFVLTSASGRILWYERAYTAGWLSERSLVRQVTAALQRTPATIASASSAQQLVGSPAPLAELHRQADQVLGSDSALAARITSLRGYPIVVNAWASWCDPCRAEFSLFAAASEHFGRAVAFLGADTNDSAGDATQFLRQHPVSYPSYEGTSGQLGALLTGGLEGLPTTVFINRDGRVTDVHTGQYDELGSLESDVQSYELHR